MTFKKILWIEKMYSSKQESMLLDHAKRIQAYAVCIRTSTDRLPAAIARFHDEGIKVFGWRWPAVVEGPHSALHWYAVDEARFIAEQLIPNGLDGYIVDPESESDRDVDDWNDESREPLAQRFCDTIRNAAGQDFTFGLTSGCRYPKIKPDIPYEVFVEASQALFPQAYWGPQYNNPNRATPTASINTAIKAWTHIAAGKPLIPIGGHIARASQAELQEFANVVSAKGLDQLHFYTDGHGVPDDIFNWIAAL